MAMAASMASQSSIMRFNVKPSQRFQNNLFNPISNLGVVTKQRIGSGFLSTPGSNDFSTIRIKRDFAVYSSVSPGGSAPPSNSMRGWLLGIVMTIVLPFITHKWGPLLKWTKNIETMVETVEQIANSVESAAEKLHEVAENIEESLPQGKLRQAFDFIENTAEEIAKDADILGNAIDKVQEVQDKVEALMEPALANDQTHKVTATATSTTTTTATSEPVAVTVETQKVEILVEPNEVVKEAGGQI